MSSVPSPASARTVARVEWLGHGSRFAKPDLFMALAYAHLSVGLFCFAADGFSARAAISMLNTWLFMELPLFASCALAVFFWRTLPSSGSKTIFLLSVPLALCWTTSLLVASAAESSFDASGTAFRIELAAAGYLLIQDWLRRVRSTDLALAKLQALQSRIRPHFIFNAINAILVLIAKDPERAESGLLDLTDMLRGMMKKNDDMVRFEEELSLTKSYMSLEALRFGERLAFACQVDDEALKATLPTLTLQPLLENAVVHGIESAGSGTVSLGAFVSDGRLTIVVSNPFQRPAEGSQNASRRHGNNMALSNIRERLELVYGKKFSYQQQIRNGVWQVRLSFPAVRGL